MSSLPSLTFHKMMLKYLKSSSKKSSGDMRRRSGFWSNWKKQQSLVRLSMQLRRQGKKLRGGAEEENIGVPPTTLERGV